MFKSIPNTPRTTLEASDEVLKAVYKAAKLGLKEDKIALAANLLPVEFRQLCQLNPKVEMVMLKGLSDGEMEASQILHDSAKEGDSKAALEILRHVHGWKTAAQQVNVEIEQRISITTALADAQKRIEGRVIDMCVEALPNGINE